MSEIEIPDATLNAACAAYAAMPRGWGMNSVDALDAALKAAAPLIVAARLRQVADRIAVILPNSRAAQAVLRADADRLDPTGSAA